MSTIDIRRATQDDIEILWDFLALAACEPDAAAAQGNSAGGRVSRRLGQADDFGFIAEQAGHVIGAVWARQFGPASTRRFIVPTGRPELSIRRSGKPPEHKAWGEACCVH